MAPPLRLTVFQNAAKLCCDRKVTIGFSRAPVAQAISHSSCRSNCLKKSTISHSPYSDAVCYFSTTSAYLKKGASKAKKITPTSSTNHIPDNKAQSNRDREIDPYDFSDLEAKIKHQVDWLRESLQKLRSGGRLSPETIEGLQVDIKHGLGGEVGQGKKVEKARLGDLAMVVPRGGRLIGVIVNEEAHLKPITTSIQSSPFSLTPQPDSQNPLQLNIPTPPSTAESRVQSLADAKKEYEKASMGVRDARGQWQKWYRKVEKEKLVIRDELEKAHKRMEGVVEKGHKSVKEVYDQAVKGMER